MIKEIVETLFCDFNYGKIQTKNVMPYCRISVERYFFSKVLKIFIIIINFIFNNI